MPQILTCARPAVNSAYIDESDLDADWEMPIPADLLAAHLDRIEAEEHGADEPWIIDDATADEWAADAEAEAAVESGHWAW